MIGIFVGINNTWQKNIYFMIESNIQGDSCYVSKQFTKYYALYNPSRKKSWNIHTKILIVLIFYLWHYEGYIQKMKIMASDPITSWEIDGETMETVLDFILGGSKITADGDCSHEIKRHLLLGRNVMTNLDGIFKSRDITLPTKVCLVKAMVFPVVMYGCESWTVKKAERQRIDAFEL